MSIVGENLSIVAFTLIGYAAVADTSGDSDRNNSLGREISCALVVNLLRGEIPRSGNASR